MFSASPVRNAVRSPLGERAAFSYLKADLRDLVRKKGGDWGTCTRLSILRRRRERRLSFEFSVWRLSRNFLPGSSQQDTACRGAGPLSVFFCCGTIRQKKESIVAGCLPAQGVTMALNHPAWRDTPGAFSPVLCVARSTALLSVGYLQKGENAWLLALVCA